MKYIIFFAIILKILLYNLKIVTNKSNMKKIIICLFIMILIQFIANVSFAHSGRTNSQGCHMNKKTGISHCH